MQGQKALRFHQKYLCSEVQLLGIFSQSIIDRNSRLLITLRNEEHYETDRS